MVTLVFVAILVAAVVLDVWVIAPVEKRLRPRAAGGSDANLEFVVPRNLFFHPGHTWARLDEDGMVTVGVDDLARTVIGDLSGVELPAVGEHVTAGLPAFGFREGQRLLRLAAPVSGTVTEANTTLGRDPSRMRWQPYKEGWAFRLNPDERMSAELGALAIGREAERWMSRELDVLRRLFDRGVLTAPVEGVLQRIGEDEWKLLERDVFKSDVRSPEASA